MNIGLDVDGSLTKLEKYQLENGKKYFKDCKEIDETQIDIAQIFHCTEEEAERFWIKYIWKYCLQEPMIEDMAEAIKLLHQKGAEFYIITQRVHTRRNDILGIIFRKMLDLFIKKYSLPIKSVVYCTDLMGEKNKVNVCKELNISLMLEDTPENIEAISPVCKVLCMDTKYNQNIQENNNIVRIHNATQFYNAVITELDCSRQVSTELKFFEDPFESEYRKARNIGVPIFKTLLKPTILHKEFIPNDGPVILCGNHLHVWDQFPAICATKRTTHWMSKKEYFESKLGPFFKKTGAICVDRCGDAHSSMEEALNYLEVGSIVGIFPEGTRNHPKAKKWEELYKEFSFDYSQEDFINKVKLQKPLLSQLNLLESLFRNEKIDIETFKNGLFNIEKTLQLLVKESTISEVDYENSILLPFKFGGVSMARKTNAAIVPFGVTGDYSIGNHNLTVNFGEPLYVKNDNLEEANGELRQKIIHLIKENKKMLR